jgi:hypothetical protein
MFGINRRGSTRAVAATTVMLTGLTLAGCTGGALAIDSTRSPAASAPGQDDAMMVGSAMADTTGNDIQAHGGGFLEKDGVYYWVGEDKSHGGADLLGVNLYRSTDLTTWEFVKRLVGGETAGVCTTGSHVESNCKIERPKLLYNEATSTFVLWGHWEPADSYEPGHLIVLSSSSVDGDYSVTRNFRPGAGEVEWTPESTWTDDPTYLGGDSRPGYPSRDFTVYADEQSGKAYMVSSQDHLTMRFYELTPDWTDVNWESSYELFPGGHREAPAMTRVGDTFYVITSSQSGWMPNQAMYSSSNDVSDPGSWSPLAPLGNSSTFYSQPTNILTVTAADGAVQHLYMGDRWKQKDLSTSSYVWLPLELESGSAKIDFTPTWTTDASGAIVTPTATLLSAGKSVSATTAETSDHSAEAANDGDRFNANTIGDNSNFYDPVDGPFSWTVDLGRARDLSRIDLAFRAYGGSEVVHGYTVSGSSDGQNWTELADRRSNADVGFTSDALSGEHRFVKVDVLSATNGHDGGDGFWAAGLVEVEVYGP